MNSSTEKSSRLVTIFGGSGFVGRHIVNALAQEGWRIIVAVRRPDLANFLIPLGYPGQIYAIQANVRYPDSVAAALKGADAVINLAGILTEGGRQDFIGVHHFGAETIAHAAKEAGISRFLQMSSIAADSRSYSAYARSKADGEAAVKAIIPEAVIVRPSFIFGPEDDFFNRFAHLACFSPFLPLIGGGEMNMQPIFVGDIAKVAATAVAGKLSQGTIYELGGPTKYSMKQLMHFICDTIERPRILLNMPYSLAKVHAHFSGVATTLSVGLFPKLLRMNLDQVELLKSDQIVSQQAIDEKRSLSALGIRGETIEAIVPRYLYRFRKTGQFAKYYHPGGN